MLIYDLVENKSEVNKRGIRSLEVIILGGPCTISFSGDDEELQAKLLGLDS